MPRFEDLPFKKRPDLSPYVVHLTKNTLKKDRWSAFDNLVHILETGEIWGSGNEGFVKGRVPAACFMDVPFGSLKYVINHQDSNPKRPRYEPYGIVVGKRYAYKAGARPVMYLSREEQNLLRIPEDELWRVVQLRVKPDGQWVSWLHEREWRCPWEFKLPSRPVAVIVKTLAEVKRLNRHLSERPRKFKAIPQCVLPLDVICHGLPYLTPAPNV